MSSKSRPAQEQEAAAPVKDETSIVHSGGFDSSQVPAAQPVKNPFVFEPEPVPDQGAEAPTAAPSPSRETAAPTPSSAGGGQ